jgi:predicted methyltransferase
MKPIILAFLLFVPFLAIANDFSTVESLLKDAMSSEVRTASETERDRNRKPVETLKFFGLRENMKVVELLPGGGWYTKLLAPALAQDGEFYVALGTRRVEENLLGLEGFEHVKVVAEDANIFRPEGSRFYSLEFDGLGVSDADIVFTFRNYHNFGPEETRRSLRRGRPHAAAHGRRQ